MKSWPKVKLGEVAPIVPAAAVDADAVWLLNLDAIEAETGDVLRREVVAQEQIGGSTVWFDEKSVLYSKLRPYLNKVVLPDGPGCATSELWPLRPIEERLSRGYLTYFLRSKTFVAHISEKVAGAKMPRVVAKEFRESLLTLPPLAEQARIVAVLDAVAATLKKRQAQLEELNALVEARFVELFGDLQRNSKALPLFFLNDLGVWTSGGTPSRSCPDYFRGDVDWFTAGELNDLFLKSSNEKITREAVEKSAAKIFAKNSLLVGMYDTAAFKMGILTKEASSNQACACVTPNATINVVWLYYAFKAMKTLFLTERRGVRQKNLSLQTIKKFQLPVAPLELQERFAAEVERVEALKTTVRDGIAETRTLFDALSQRYFG